MQVAVHEISGGLLPVAGASALAQTFPQHRRAYSGRMRVLIAEDELFLAEALQTGLRREAIAADIALDGDEALARIALNDYDVIVLDRDLPGTHGDAVSEHVAREHPDVRILMLTAAARLRDKLDGFALGADDYLPKPFAFEELLVRLRALARRPPASAPPVLELLMRADGGVVSAETMLEKAWDEHADPLTSAPRVTMSTLRKALGEPDLIVTVPGAGYRLAAR
jgi:two-component system response regulator VanR